MSDGETDNFELVFEGMADPSPEALRKIKATLIADLDMSIDQVQSALTETTPTVLRVASTEAELQSFYRLVKSAGGKVLIVSRAIGDTAHTQEESEDISISESGSFTIDFTEQIVSTTRDSQMRQNTEPRIHEISDIDDPESILKDPQFNEAPPVEGLPLMESDLPTPEITAEPLAAENDLSLQTLSLDDETSPIIPPELARPAPLPDPSQNEDVSRLDKTPLFDFGSLDPAPVESDIEPETPPSPSEQPIFDLDSSRETIQEIDSSSEDHSVIPPSSSSPKIPREANIPEDAAEALRDVARLQEQLDQTIGRIAGQDENGEDSSISGSLSLDETAPLTEEPLTPPPSTEAPPDLNIALDTESSSSLPREDLTSAPSALVAEKNREAAPPSVETPVQNRLLKVTRDAPRAPEENIPNPSTSTRTMRMRLKKLHLDLVIPIMVGGALLGVANYLYFSTPTSTKNLDALEQAAISSIKAEEEREKAKVPPPPKAVAFVGSATSESALFRATVAVFESGTIANYTIEGSTPQPPALTPEQIVNGIVGPPWIRKIEVGEFPLKKNDEGILRAAGLARVFVEYKDQRVRVPAQAEITASLNEARDAITLAITVLSPGMELPTHLEDPGSYIEPLPDGKFKIAAKGTVTLLKPKEAGGT